MPLPSDVFAQPFSCDIEILTPQLWVVCEDLRGLHGWHLVMLAFFE